MFNVVQKKILIVDDELAIRLNIQKLLKILGFITEMADNGKDAYDLILQNEYDLVISDIKMPVMDGYNLLKAVRNNPEKKNTRFVFLSSNIDLVDVRAGMLLGADDYIIKPYNQHELIRVVKSNIEDSSGKLSEFYEHKFNSILDSVE